MLNVDFLLLCSNYTILIREIIAGWVLLPMMDVVASPNVINSLVILCATYKYNKNTVSSKHQKQVQFLHNFSIETYRNSSFACDLKSVLKSTELLYAFMQFLKKEGPVHILQFCLDIGKNINSF